MRLLTPASALTVIVGLSLTTIAEPPAAKPGGAVIVKGEGYALVTPAGWTASQIKTRTMLMHLPGDAKGVPAFDDSGAPLQTGMSVEHFNAFKKTLAELEKIQVDSINRAPQLKLIGEPLRREIKLPDGRDAVLMTFHFDKENGRRRSTQLKLITKGGAEDHWIASAWAVGGPESKAVAPDGPLAKWLATHLELFSLDATALEGKALPSAFEPKL